MGEHEFTKVPETHHRMMCGRPYMRLSDTLLTALQSIEEEQLDTGEIPNYRKLDNGAWEYHFSPLVSAYVADALAIFDPMSNWFDPFVVEKVGEDDRFAASRIASRIRRGIRRFLAWQQSGDGLWRFFGRGSSLPPDRNTTACCALVLLDRINISGPGLERVQRTLRGLREACALRGPREAGKLTGDEGPPSAYERVAEANLLRLRILTTGRAEASELPEESPRAEESQPEPAVLHALGRLSRQSGFDPFSARSESWIDSLIHSQAADASFGSPLNTALAVGALLDFQRDGQAAARAAAWLRGLNWFRPFPSEEFCTPVCGSPSLTTAFAISAVARALA